MVAVIETAGDGAADTPAPAPAKEAPVRSGKSPIRWSSRWPPGTDRSPRPGFDRRPGRQAGLAGSASVRFDADALIGRCPTPVRGAPVRARAGRGPGPVTGAAGAAGSRGRRAKYVRVCTTGSAAAPGAAASAGGGLNLLPWPQVDFSVWRSRGSRCRGSRRSRCQPRPQLGDDPTSPSTTGIRHLELEALRVALNRGTREGRGQADHARVPDQGQRQRPGEVPRFQRVARSLGRDPVLKSTSTSASPRTRPTGWWCQWCATWTAGRAPDRAGNRELAKGARQQAAPPTCPAAASRSARWAGSVAPRSRRSSTRRVAILGVSKSR